MPTAVYTFRSLPDATLATGDTARVHTRQAVRMEAVRENEYEDVLLTRDQTRPSSICTGAACARVRDCGICARRSLISSSSTAVSSVVWAFRRAPLADVTRWPRDAYFLPPWFYVSGHRTWDESRTALSLSTPLTRSSLLTLTGRTCV